MIRNACATAFLLIAIPASAAAPTDVFRSAPGPSAEDVEWQHLRTQPSTAGVSDFLLQFPDSPHRDEANKIIRGLNSLESVPPPSPITEPSTVGVNPSAQPAVRATGAKMSQRCNSILERSQLGEPIADADRVFLSANCR
jgi:hypothetical protein